ncbi:uncharacterized protein BO88DRAFT_406294 [Aspergillus vadensis CBS 113365]|uniref:Secreted protein n=1 Tax=Aspergillus vadensis (strain CBS 113365 / IMI 142717 / IBT 24658) TaxID=1448311 RepID=A0A319B6K0_ASPVC|nr:hypothetical protein BO88DRAFT_406294 [Aspergillus vadensis CBS 113365]PYH67434.1 hypothetical protein BO88DRAFT_406294 [Aspergillus vadensis CBS 113365]
MASRPLLLCIICLASCWPRRRLGLPIGHPSDLIDEPLTYHASCPTHLASRPLLVAFGMTPTTCSAGSQGMTATSPAT